MREQLRTGAFAGIDNVKPAELAKAARIALRLPREQWKTARQWAEEVLAEPRSPRPHRSVAQTPITELIRDGRLFRRVVLEQVIAAHDQRLQRLYALREHVRAENECALCQHQGVEWAIEEPWHIGTTCAIVRGAPPAQQEPAT
jgi:hypothetical protein